MMDLPDKTELGLLPRLIAAAWFGLAASIPVFCFMLTLGRGAAFIPAFLFFYGALPILIGALFGFAVGVKILDPVSSTSKPLAALRGIVVALLSNLVFMTLFLVQMEIARPAGSLGFVLIVALGGLMIMFFPVAASGALAGWTLCNLSCRGDFWEWLLNLPRVTTTTANVWNLVASVIVLVNCIAGVYYAASLVRQ